MSPEPRRAPSFALVVLAICMAFVVGQLDGTVMQTRAEMAGDVRQAEYAIDLTFETDPAATAAIPDALRKQICAIPETIEVLELKFSINTTFDAKTPHGPGQFHLRVNPRDCPGVTVKAS